MKTKVLAVLFLAMVGCISVHHKTQTVTVGFGGHRGLCSYGTVNGKAALLCPDCLVCPKGEKCQAQNALGLYARCPVVK